MCKSKLLYSFNFIIAWLIGSYQRFLSPLLGMRCRFYPSCSEYARLCFLHYPLPKALLKSCFRILRCQPFAKAYEDDPLSDPYRRQPEESFLDAPQTK